jgi:peptide/nickel transport system permease protein
MNEKKAMFKDSKIEDEYKENAPSGSESRRFFRVFFGRKIVLFGLCVIVLFVFTAIFAPLISPYNPNEMHLNEAMEQSSFKHLLGTDPLGRDTLSRLIYGTRTSLLIGVVVTGAAMVVGSVLGLIAGYYGGILYTILMRLTDALMAFPALLLAVTLAAMFGIGIKNVILALGITVVPVYIRVMCAQALSNKENEYITAARSLGASHTRIMFSHILPNCFAPALIVATLMIGATILSESGLSFLGVGIKPPTAAWGAMVASGYQYLLKLPILSFAPGVAILLVVFAFNMVGDGLRDALDPRLRGKL